MQSGMVLQTQHASACTYHIVKSHPVPCGHVTFKNATLNDSMVHNNSLKGRAKFHLLGIVIIHFPRQLRSTRLFVKLCVKSQPSVFGFFPVCACILCAGWKT